MREFYDVFISSKSEDSGMARELFGFLVSKGLKVFFSQETLPAMGQSRYKAYIDDALEAAYHMIVVGSCREHIESEWVKYEWNTFTNEMLAGRKSGNIISVLGDGMTIPQLPISLRQFEAIPFSRGDFGKILRYVGRREDGAAAQAVPQPPEPAQAPSAPETESESLISDDIKKVLKFSAVALNPPLGAALLAANYVRKKFKGK